MAANVDTAISVFEEIARLGLAELQDESTLFAEDIEDELSILITFREEGEEIVLFENEIESARFDSLSGDFRDELFDYVSDALNF